MLVAIIGFDTMFSVMQRGDEWNELEQAFAQSNAEDQHAEDQVEKETGSDWWSERREEYWADYTSTEYK